MYAYALTLARYDTIHGHAHAEGSTLLQLFLTLPMHAPKCIHVQYADHDPGSTPISKYDNELSSKTVFKGIGHCQSNEIPDQSSVNSSRRLPLDESGPVWIVLPWVPRPV